jgi:hypothetical protein
MLIHIHVLYVRTMHMRWPACTKHTGISALEIGPVVERGRIEHLYVENIFVYVPAID